MIVTAKNVNRMYDWLVGEMLDWSLVQYRLFTDRLNIYSSVLWRGLVGYCD